MTYTRFFSMVFILALCGCSNADTDEKNEVKANASKSTPAVKTITPISDDSAMTQESPEKSPLITVTGQVVYMDLEGGFWGIVTEDGNKYVPQQGLTEEYRKNGLVVKAQLKPRADMISFIMWGTQAELISIESDGTIRPVTLPGRRSEI